MVSRYTGMREHTWNPNRAVGGAVAVGCIVAVRSWIALPVHARRRLRPVPLHRPQLLAGPSPSSAGSPYAAHSGRARAALLSLPGLFVLAPFTPPPLRAATALFVGFSTALL